MGCVRMVLVPLNGFLKGCLPGGHLVFGSLLHVVIYINFLIYIAQIFSLSEKVDIYQMTKFSYINIFTSRNHVFKGEN